MIQSPDTTRSAGNNFRTSRPCSTCRASTSAIARMSTSGGAMGASAAAAIMPETSHMTEARNEYGCIARALSTRVHCKAFIIMYLRFEPSPPPLSRKQVGARLETLGCQRILTGEGELASPHPSVILMSLSSFLLGTTHGHCPTARKHPCLHES